MFSIQVPATSANLGPGFDSMGVALSLYLTVEVRETSDTWLVEHPFGKDIPSDQTNLIVEAALSINPNIEPHHLVCHSTIPMTRGLGSSSTAIVAGIELANQLGQMNLSDRQKVNFASQFEGHPDNVAPAILGGLVVAYYAPKKQETFYQKIDLDSLSFIAVVPNYQLSTKESRSVLPSQMAFKDAVEASSIANLLVAAFANKDYTLAGNLLEMDLFHESYRSPLVAEFQRVRQLAHSMGIEGTFLSGAGPTIMTILQVHQAQEFYKACQDDQMLSTNCQIYQLQVDHEGLMVR